MRVFFAVALLCLIAPQAAHGQAPPCPDPPAPISNSYTFQGLGESITIPFSTSPCHTVAVNVSWSNGLNYGSNLKVSFLDASGQPIYYEDTISAYLPGSRIFPFSSPYPYPWRGSRSSLLNPAALKIETIYPFAVSCFITYDITFTARPGYNVGGDSFTNAPLVPALPTTYLGSMYDGRTPPFGGVSIDPGQFFKVHLKCNQAIYAYGSVTVSSGVSSNFRVDIYDANQQLITPNWIFTGSMGTTSFASNPFVNPNSTESDFYIKAWSYNWPIYDFTLNIDEYVASNNVNNPRPVAPDATGGTTPNSEEFHLPASIDTDVLTVSATELWAKVYWPADFSGGPYPLAVFLHGNHSTCGKIGTSPRLDDNSDYTLTGTCPAGYSVINNHLGFEYLATQLASRGYIVSSINANRGITGGDQSHPDDPAHIFSRGRLVLKHLETLQKWNAGPSALITPTTLGTLRKNSNNWFGMKITVGSQAITVYSLGRIFVSGNTGTHTVKLVRASDSVDLASVSIPMTGGTAGQFKYVNLTTPIRLAANTSYYVASKEVNNGDFWYDSNTIVGSTTIATVNGRVTSTNGTTWSTSGAVAGNVYVPVDLKYQVLSVNFTGKVDFTNVGLMGHSRGGQGVLAAYNLYRNAGIDPRATPPDIAWSTRIPGMNIKGIFEIAPTDYFLPTASDGSGVQYPNADGTAFNALLPMCDGDVRSLQGVRVFDRAMSFTGGNTGVPAESPATQKSTYGVWGANHNFFNTEWQQTESLGCKGPGNTRLFPFPVTDGSGSPNQRTTGSASVLAFFRANVGSSPSTAFNQNFKPNYQLPAVITSIPERIDQGFTSSPSLTITKVLFDFTATLPPNSDYLFTAPAVAFNNAATIPEHDYVTNPTPCFGGSNPPPCPAPSPIAVALTVGRISWESADCANYFQANWKAPGTGESVTGYQTLDFRVSRQIDDIRNSSASTNFQIQFIAADGSPTGAAVSLNKYMNLAGPVGLDDGSPNGFLHPILQTVRIPLSDFSGANLFNVRGVRFVFSDTPKGAIYLANIRLSNQQ
ncbi:MAG: hypothetical protein H0U60_11165 [Blastocatellia bacterium]|nr:hypothetical protein [Blastocatellia bacterium]